MEILRGQPATLRVDFGTVLDAVPTVAVTDANGNAVSGVGTVEDGGGGVYTAPLDALTDLTVLSAVWSGLLSTSAIEATTTHEVVGSLLFSVDAARNHTISGAQTPLSDPTAFPDHEIERIRALVTHQFEERTSRAWTRRHCRGVASGTGHHSIAIADIDPRTVDGPLVRPGRETTPTVVAVTANGSTVDIADVVILKDHLVLTSGIWPRATITNPLNVTVEWEYGPTSTDFEAFQHGLAMAIANLVPSDLSGYATQFQSENGVTNFGPGGFAYPSKVHEWLKRHRSVLIA